MQNKINVFMTLSNSNVLYIVGLHLYVGLIHLYEAASSAKCKAGSPPGNWVSRP